MSSFYSIIYAVIDPVAGDKLAVGLFMRGAGKPRFAWSKNRASVVRELIKLTQGLRLETLRSPSHLPTA